MKTAKYGVVKWDKNDRIFYYSIPDHFASKKGFHKCPNCTTEESEIEEKYDLTYEIVNDKLTCKAKLYDWTCRNCSKKIEFKDLNELTRNFLINTYKRDLEIAANFTVNLIRKVKKNRKIEGSIDVGGLGFKGGYKIENPNIIHICGNCKSKDKFSPEDVSKNIFRCQKCGYINIPQ